MSTPGSYRLPIAPDQQRDQSVRMILEAADAVSPQSVFVLGAGRCDEIPLTSLAEQFERVVLTDSDRVLLEEGIASANLTAENAQRLQTEICDLVGATAPVETICDEVLAGASTLETAIAAISAALPSVQPSTPAMEPCDLVVASCVLSQVTVGLIQRVRQRLVQRFPGSDDQVQSHPTLTGALNDLTRRCEAAFVDLLYCSLKPGGRIYFSDTVQMCFVRLADDGQAWTTPGSWRMTKTLRIDDYFDHRFSALKRRRWNWVVNSPVKPTEQGRLYDVQAMILSIASRAP